MGKWLELSSRWQGSATARKFNKSGPNGQDNKDASYETPSSNQLDRLYAAITNTECKNAKLQFFGEYLHAFEDTFSHRQYNNVPYPIYGGFGHGADGSNPDYSYNHGKWQNNEDRTLMMEVQVFNKMSPFVVAGNTVKDWQDLIPVMEQFNATAEHESGPNNAIKDFSNAQLTGKLDILNAKLKEWGYKNADGSDIDLLTINAFNQTQADSNRNEYLCDASGQRLKQTDYPGTILPTNACP